MFISDGTEDNIDNDDFVISIVSSLNLRSIHYHTLKGLDVKMKTE